MATSFCSLYENWWFVEDRQRDPSVERQLAAEYRTAWETGDREDRQDVLDYIFRRRKEEGFDILVGAIGSGDAHLAGSALGLASALIITYGYDLGPGIGQALETFRRAFPEDPLSAYAAWVQTKIDRARSS